jgi:hypothetical protein
MKKIILSAVFIMSLCSAQYLFAQEASSNDGCGIFGVRFMPTITSLQFSESQGVVETSFVMGYGAGVLLGRNFNDHVGLQGGNFCIRSLHRNIKQADDVEHKVKLSYINVPLLLSLNSGIRDPVNFNFVIGPQLGLNTGSSIDVDNGGEADTVHAVLAVKRGDIGFAYGSRC